MCNGDNFSTGDAMLIIWFMVVFGFIGFIALRMFFVRRSALFEKRKNRK